MVLRGSRDGLLMGIGKPSRICPLEVRRTLTLVDDEGTRHQ